MKRVKMFIILVLSIFICNGKVFAMTAPSATSSTDYSSCIAFSDGFKNISNSLGSYYYKYCYRATCYSNAWSKVDMATINGYRCQNGNGTPYTQVTSDGCSKYEGSCSQNGSGVYCTKVVLVDCNRTSGGGTYVNPYTTTTQETQAPTPTTTPTTNGTVTPSATKKTTKKTTTKKTTKATTVSTMPTETTTTTTTTTRRTNNTNINKIFVKDTDIKYNRNKDSYTIKLKYDITDVDVRVELEDETSTYEVTGNKDMPNEETEILIKVTAVSGDTKEVTIKVKRYTNESGDCTLANIYSEEYNLDFSKNTYNYKLKLPKNVNSLDLEIIPTFEDSTYTVEGNEKLKNNSVIKIDVRAQDGTMCTYEIKIKKSSNTWKYILIIVILVGILGATSFLLYRYLKKSKGKYKYE